MFSPAMIAKAKKAKELHKSVPAPLKVHEHIEDRPEGAGLYVFQALFAKKEDAERFMQLYQLSSDLEKYVEGD
ncbi:hypothetical protein NTE_03397 [Candidatus Nitrososphaera evergladensis SR1]|uniref:Uncharacterized protein n=1 Tax=Candidatus Nitrososphaera evergladensis SR1 TaxID=1459636 RepID=A0A075MVZ4_9ARCH|nr:hypothetical protein [Candidatus Nitrososphaera evergladensis]AIF85425.1 hypothetical protein NTE_03397 [Candidatus Nitrososphaera evergladensis SR1]